MRMRGVFAGRCRNRIKSFDYVNATLIQSVPVQYDGKAAKIDTFQHDRVRGDRDTMPLHADGNLIEL